MEDLTIKILKKDKRIKYISKLSNYLIDSCVELGWYYTTNNITNKSFEIIVSKKIPKKFDEVNYTISGLLRNAVVLITVDKTSFYGYGILPLCQLFVDNLDNKIFEFVKDEEKKGRQETSMSADYILNRIFEKFPLSAKQLLKRHDKRATLEISDEYDVQDYLHSILLLFFDDVRDEDTIPKKAGGSSRGDFLLAKEGIMVETKVSSSKLKDKDLGEQIIVDIKRYTGNPAIKKIYFFVYNPYYDLKNPVGLEKDLSKDKNIEVIVKIFPK